MHDPKTVAFEIYLGKRQKKDGNYRSPLVTIWHNDPETNGTDDSCGWLIRGRHCNQEILSKIKKEFKFNLDNNYWFDTAGNQIFSTGATLMLMYKTALWIHFKNDRKKVDSFIRKYHTDILWLAENPHDCIGDEITGKFYISSGTSLTNKDRFQSLPSIIYADIMRKERKWYQHPKWHIRHWSFSFPIFRSLYRRYIERCSICRTRFKGRPAFSSWSSKKVWCHDCEVGRSKPNANI